MNFHLTLYGTAASWLLLVGCTSSQSNGPLLSSKPEATAGKTKVSFTESIKPILSERCTICHNSRVLPKRPNFESRAGVMRSGVIVPGHPETSLFITHLQEDPMAAEKAMPPVGHRLTKEEITLLRTWIAEGATWPSGTAGRVRPAFIPKE